MYKIVLTIFLCVALQSAFAQIPNAGFENWTNGDPDGWVTSNINGFITNVTQSTTSHSGSSAARGEVVDFFGHPLQPVLQDGTGARGFAYNQRPISITGYYQFFPTGGDRFGVNVALTKGGSSGTYIAIAAIADPTTRSSYTQFNATFNYQTADIPDTCILQFQIVGPDTATPPHPGSYFLLDDLAFSGLVSVNNENTMNPETFSLSQNYPNPFNPSTSISYFLPEGSHVKLRVFNILGAEVATLVNGYRGRGSYTEKFDAVHLTSGVYFYRLETEQFSSMKKMLLLK